jgi:hypothetical protein
MSRPSWKRKTCPRSMSSAGRSRTTRGIRVNAIALGSIRSVETAHIHDDPANGPARRRNRMIPQPGTVDDVAELVAFLASPRSAFLTAAVVPLDGGAMSAYPAPVIAEAIQLRPSVQVSRALWELGYCALGATELPDTVSDKINWAFAGRDRGLIMYRNPALRRGFRNIDCGRGSGRCWRPDRVSSLSNWILSVTEDFWTRRSPSPSATLPGDSPPRPRSRAGSGRTGTHAKGPARPRPDTPADLAEPP